MIVQTTPGASPNSWNGTIQDESDQIFVFSCSPTMTPPTGGYFSTGVLNLPIIGTATDSLGHTLIYNVEVTLNGTPTTTSVPVNVKVTSNPPGTLLPPVTINVVLQYTPAPPAPTIPVV